MSTTWVYLGQQAIVLAIAAVVAGTALLAGRRVWRRPAGAAVMLLEAPAIAALLFLFGTNGYRLGWTTWLPGHAIPLFVGIGLAFYWLAVLWPLRVFAGRARLAEQPLGPATIAVALALPLGAAWACFVEPRLLEAEELPLEFREAGDREIRIAHLTDLQLLGFGSRERSMVDAVNAHRPHVVVITGDYVASRIADDDAIAAARDVLRSLRASHGIYCTAGDSDDWVQRNRIFAGLDVHYLVNANRLIDVDGVPVRICGVNHVYPAWHEVGRDATDAELVIVGCHTPDPAEECGRRVPHADLFLCGHTHGGQVQIPGFGPPITLSRVSRDVAAGGPFTTASGLRGLLSRGLGMEGGYAPRIRFCCRPHVYLLTLHGGGAQASK